jgi:hypothetical protein
MASGYILVEGMRPGSRLEGLPLTLRAIERRLPRSDAAPDQPSVWTTVEFDFPDEDAERIAQAFSEVLGERGGWYTDFTVGGETFVVFANRIFRYPSGDEAGRTEAQAYGRSVGVPETQLDWRG